MGIADHQLIPGTNLILWAAGQRVSTCDIELCWSALLILAYLSTIGMAPVNREAFTARRKRAVANLARVRINLYIKVRLLIFNDNPSKLPLFRKQMAAFSTTVVCTLHVFQCHSTKRSNLTSEGRKEVKPGSVTAQARLERQPRCLVLDLGNDEEEERKKSDGENMKPPPQALGCPKSLAPRTPCNSPGEVFCAPPVS